MMRYIFVGTVEASYHALEEMLIQGANVVGVFTLAVEYASRHSDFADLSPLAQSYRIPLWHINNINEPEVVAQMQSLKPDYIFVIGWSQILKAAVLRLPKYACIGFHPSLLPQNRGRAVLPWTILQGLRRSGGTLFYLDEGVDSGDILMQKAFDLEPDETARTLYNKITAVLREMIREALPLLESGKPPRYPQDHSKATYCAKRTPADGLIDWQQPAERIWTLIRAVGDPYPGAFTFHRGRKVIIWEAKFIGSAPYIGLPGQIHAIRQDGVLVQCGDGKHILLQTVQPEGGERCAAVDYFTKVHEVLGIDWLRLYYQLQESNWRAPDEQSVSYRSSS
jgi:methionyl-tRNA formyltransferase